MWVFDLVTLEFLEVNAAAIAHYGYSREEFLASDYVAEDGRLATVDHPDLGERVMRQRARSHEAALQDATCASSDGNIARLEHFERDDRRVEQVSHFMSQEPCPLVPSRGLLTQGGLILFAAEFGDCAALPGLSGAK